jgi:hypothetical protein
MINTVTECGISKRTVSEETFTIGLEVVYTNWNPHAATNSDNIP